MTNAVSSMLRATCELALVQCERNDSPSTERVLERAAVATMDAGMSALVVVDLMDPTSDPASHPGNAGCLFMLTRVLVLRQVITSTLNSLVSSCVTVPPAGDS